MLILTRADIEPLLSMPHVIDAVERAHADLTLGRAAQPDRAAAQIPGRPAVFVPMTAALDTVAGVKLLVDIPGNPAGPRQQSTVVLVDSRTGACEAFLHGEAITRYRTAAASAVATRHLARPESAVLGLIGAGALARAHLEAIRLVRPIDTVLVWSRTRATAEEFARRTAGPALDVRVVEEAEAVVAGADVLCTLTPAPTPVVRGAWFRPGLHVNAVGAPPRPDHREIDSDAVRVSRLVVDTIHTATTESGAVVIPLAAGELDRDQVRTELGDVITGRRAGRISPDDITLFNSVGLPIQDLAAARLVLEAARERGAGQFVDLTGRAAPLVPAT